MPEIIVAVTKDGTTTVRVEGYQGSSCALKSQPYRDALGLTTTDSRCLDASQPGIYKASKETTPTKRPSITRM